MKNEREKSDPSIVAKKPANKPGQPGAESAEPREGTEGNTGEQHTCRTQSRESVSQGLERVREASKAKKEGTVHRIVAPCDDRSIEGRVFLAQAGGGTRGGWTDMAKLQGEPGSQPKRNCMRASTEAPIERFHHGDGTSQNPTGGNARWGSPRWKIRSFNVQWWRCLMQSTKKTSLGSRTGSDLDAVSTMRWTPWLSGLPARR